MALCAVVTALGRPGRDGPARGQGLVIAQELAFAGQAAHAGIRAVPLAGGKAGSDVVPHLPDTQDAPDVVAALQAANARLRAQNAGLRAENAELKAQLAQQAEKIARLERLISRNSGNSSCSRPRPPRSA